MIKISFPEWTRYFETIIEFLEGASRQYGVANESFTEYVVDRLDLCISTCSSLSEQLTINGSGGDIGSDEETIVVRYRTKLQHLLDGSSSPVEGV